MSAAGADRSGTALPTDRAVRRACLFAGFDADGTVDDSVLGYLRELARFADVFCLFDHYTAPGELAEVRAVVTDGWAIRHGAGHAGSWSMLARDLVGWDRLSTYDEVLLVSDACYLLRPLDAVFTRMSAQPCDWWGLQATVGSDGQRVGGGFRAVRAAVIADPSFRDLLDRFAPNEDETQQPEIDLDRLLTDRGHVLSTFVTSASPADALTSELAFELIEHEQFPLLDRRLLSENPGDVAGLARWKERVLALVPEAGVAAIEENLLRTAPADGLDRSFSIEVDDRGAVRVPTVLKGNAFVKADKQAPKHADRWVFAVDPVTHRLPENSRAVFDRVAADADIQKIILTRSVRLELAGTNVVTAALSSPAGREHLIGAGVVFVRAQPFPSLEVRAQLDLHRLIGVRGGLMLMKHGRTADVAEHPGAEPPEETGPLRMLHTATKPKLTALLTASDVDQISEVSAQWPTRFPNAWRTGIPAHDHLLAEDLPDDLAEQEQRLRRVLDGRRLVLIAPALRSGSWPAAPSWSPSEVAHLTSWARANDAVIGVREAIGDLGRATSRIFGDTAVDVSQRRFGSTAVVLRATDVLLTDYAGSALDFTLTGRPVISYAPDLDAAEDHLLYDPDHMFPGRVCRDFDDLADSLGTVFGRPTPQAVRQYERVRDLLIDHRDGQNAARVVDHVLDLLERSPS